MAEWSKAAVLKTVEGASPPGVRIPISPPVVNCTHRCENGECVQFFFLHECFGAITPFEKPKIENPSRLNWINLQVDFKIEVGLKLVSLLTSFYMKI